MHAENINGVTRKCDFLNTRLILLLKDVLAYNTSGSSSRRDRKRENVTVELYIICINIVPNPLSSFLSPYHAPFVFSLTCPLNVRFT